MADLESVWRDVSDSCLLQLTLLTCSSWCKFTIRDLFIIVSPQSHQVQFALDFDLNAAGLASCAPVPDSLSAGITGRHGMATLGGQALCYILNLFLYVYFFLRGEAMNVCWRMHAVVQV